MINPFVQHRPMLVFGGYSTACALRQVALSLWNGNGYPFALHKIGNMDSKHYQIFQDMLAWYRTHGEGCKDFMRLCSELSTIVSVAEVVEKFRESYDKRAYCPACGEENLSYKVMEKGRVQMSCLNENCGCIGFSVEGGGADEDDKVTAAWQDAGGRIQARFRAMASDEFMRAETYWFHVFRDMIESGDVAKMGPDAFTVYAVIKSHTNYSSGRIFPGVATIVEKSGVSDKQVRRKLKTLVDFGYLSIRKNGRKNEYTLREKVCIRDEEGRQVAVAAWNYIPHGIQAATDDIKKVVLNGDFGVARIVHIERLNLQINTGSGVAVQFNQGDFDRLSDEMKKALLKIKESLAHAKL